MGDLLFYRFIVIVGHACEFMTEGMLKKDGEGSQDELEIILKQLAEDGWSPSFGCALYAG